MGRWGERELFLFPKVLFILFTPLRKLSAVGNKQGSYIWAENDEFRPLLRKVVSMDQAPSPCQGIPAQLKSPGFKSTLRASFSVSSQSPPPPNTSSCSFQVHVGSDSAPAVEETTPEVCEV